MNKSIEYPVVQVSEEVAYIDTLSVHGTMALVLPYKKRKGHRYYLLDKKWIPNWDSDIDTCGISAFFKENEIESGLCAMMEETMGVEVQETELQYLGICAGDRHTNSMCKLYAVDLTQHSDETVFLDETKSQLFWSDAEGIIKSVDALLHAAYSSLQYIFPE